MCDRTINIKIFKIPLYFKYYTQNKTDCRTIKKKIAI